MRSQCLGGKSRKINILHKQINCQLRLEGVLTHRALASDSNSLGKARFGIGIGPHRQSSRPLTSPRWHSRTIASCRTLPRKDNTDPPETWRFICEAFHPKQGYLVHKKSPSPLGPPQVPRLRATVGSYGGAISYERGTPVILHEGSQDARAEWVNSGDAPV